MTHVYVLLEHAHKRLNKENKEFTELADAVVRGVYSDRMGALVALLRLDKDRDRGYLAIIRKSIKGLL